MATPPLLSLTDITLTLGGDPLFAGADMSVAKGEKLALVGRNGSGKSTLMKIAAGDVEADSGTRFLQPGAAVARLPQEPDFVDVATLGAYVGADLDEADHWRAESAMDALSVPAARAPDAASGGERRRAALARLIAAEPDVMLLDEPTNHLDIAAIAWLEDWLRQTRAGFVLISHDRALLKAVTRQVLWLDRGVLRRSEKGFAAFDDWREGILAQEAVERKKLDKLIAQETAWSREGISARRTRNQGRLRRLHALRAERRAQRAQAGAAAMALDSGAASGKMVIEAKGVSRGFGGAPIVRDLSTRILRGDRVALVGPNGAGKTTLLNLLTGTLAPDAGVVRLGTNLEVATFDQTRSALDPEASLWDTLTGADALGVSGAGDQVMVRGRPKHVVAYLKDFLFDERQARGPVKALSGGERARLLLSMLMARPSNLLVLDEPTNDLDVETLELLEELLGDYDGTVLLVSHDRDFIDRVATSVIVAEGQGRWVEYAGGWTDMLAQRGSAPVGEAPPVAAPSRPDKPAAAPATKTAKKLSYAEARRLDLLPAEMEKLEAEIARLEQFLADPDLYARDPAAFTKASEALAARREALEAAETAWLELEDKRAALE